MNDILQSLDCYLPLNTVRFCSSMQLNSKQTPPLIVLGFTVRVSLLQFRIFALSLSP